MDAVSPGVPGEEAVRALAASAGIVAAVRAGSLPVERLQEAATRVVALQMWSAQLQG